MGNHQRRSARLHRWRVEPPTGLVRRHWAEGVCSIPRGAPSTFLRSLRSMALTPLLRYYGRCDSCSLRRGSAGIIVRRPPHRLLGEQASLIHVLGLPAIPSPTTCVSPTSLLRATPQLAGLPSASPRVWASPFTRRLAAHAGRIKFVILRTGRSPPVALHPVSRRGSYLRLQAGERMPEEDFHLSDQARFQTH